MYKRQEQAVIGDAVADGGHGMFTDAEPEIAPFRGFRGEVPRAGKVVFIGAVPVSYTHLDVYKRQLRKTARVPSR